MPFNGFETVTLTVMVTLCECIINSLQLNWSHVLALRAWTLKKAHTVSCQEE